MSQVKLYTRRDLAKITTLGIAGTALAGPSSAPLGRRNLAGMMGVMMSGASSPKAKYTGVQLVGSSVKLENNILSNFSSGNYGQLPFHVDVDNAEYWEVCICAKIPSIYTGNGCIGGQGTSNGWTPIYLSGANVSSYMAYVGWPVTWDDTSYTISSSWAGKFPAGTWTRFKCVFTGTRYEMYINGVMSAYKSSTAKCRNSGVEYTMIGGNRGNAGYTGEFDLSKFYIKIGDELTWEGVSGAYARANSSQT